MNFNKKHIIYFISLLILTFLLVACSNDKVTDNVDNNTDIIENNDSSEDSIENKEEKEEPIVIEEEIDPIIEKINNMTLEEKLGQMIMIGVDTYQISEQEKKMIQDNYIGGVILFKRNVQNSNQLLNLNNQIKGINKEVNDIPILISVDEEGGLVSRMPSEIINLPNKNEIGEVNNIELATKVGNAIGERVYDFGFNMTMAPVLDVNNNPNNPVIGIRSFGDNPEVVSNMGIAEMKAIQSQNVIPVIKHFPGHGDTDVDSHKGLPVINHNLERLNKIELAPFKKAINEGADVVMVGHIIMTQLDNQNPASLSQKIVTDLLRNDLNFNGVVITDDMTMGAIIHSLDIGKAAIQSVKAGNDIILVSHGYENKINVIQSLHTAALNGEISEETINDSVYRILTLKEKYQLNDNEDNSVDINKINQSSKDIDEILKSFY